MAEKMDSLPSDIKTVIFSQLPTNSIIQCKRVCKTWRACVHELLNDPSFINTHTQRLLLLSSSPTTTNVASSFTSFLAREKHSKPGNQFHIVGSCNGLVCLVDKNYNAYICNPVTFTREYVNLPAPPQEESGNKIIAIGFGYLPYTNEYKFVRIAFDGIRNIYVSVYTLGSGKWSIKKLQDDSYGDLRYVTIATAAGFHSKGVICWNTITSSLAPYGNIIISYNLKLKKLGIDRSTKDEEMCMLGRRFCYIRTLVRKQEICLRNKTRTDLIRIKPELENDFTPPFALEKKIFLSYDYMKFVSYDTNTSSRSQMVDWVEILLPYMSKFEMIPYIMSFVSIRALGETACVLGALGETACVVARKRN